MRCFYVAMLLEFFCTARLCCFIPELPYAVLTLVYSLYIFSLGYWGWFAYDISLMLFNVFFFLIYNTCVLVESNRVPFDLPEAESELVAGFMTEFSSLYFSIIILSEYFSLVIFSLFLCLLFGLDVMVSGVMLFLWCLTRAVLNRLKYDELLTLGWYCMLILSFAVLMLLLFLF